MSGNSEGLSALGAGLDELLEWRDRNFPPASGESCVGDLPVIAETMRGEPVREFGSVWRACSFKVDWKTRLVGVLLYVFMPDYSCGIRVRAGDTSLEISEFRTEDNSTFYRVSFAGETVGWFASYYSALIYAAREAARKAVSSSK